jgi:hypothetical protein
LTLTRPVLFKSTYLRDFTEKRSSTSNLFKTRSLKKLLTKLGPSHFLTRRSLFNKV